MQVQQKEEEEDIQDLLDDNADMFGEDDDSMSTYPQIQGTHIRQEDYRLNPGQNITNTYGYEI